MKRARMVALTVLSLSMAAGSAAADGLSAKEQLGRNLFFDKISSPNSMACAACHAPEVGFTGPNAGINLGGAVYRGAVPQRFGNRKPPSSAYATFAPIFHFDPAEGLFIGGNFWDGRATGEHLGNPAADQALGPFLNPVEQNNASKEVVLAAVAKSHYAGMWVDVWGEPLVYGTPAEIDLNYDRIGLAIGAYEASPEVNAFSSKFDFFWNNAGVMGMDVAAIDLSNWSDYDNLGLNRKELHGLALFNDAEAGKCSFCHVLDPVMDDSGSLLPPVFTDFSFDNVGSPRNPDNPFYDMDEVYLDDGTPINPMGDAWVDPGLGGFLMNHPNPVWQAMAGENLGKQKVPTLRNVGRAPSEEFPKAFLHNGYFKSLKDVVHFYNTRDVENWPMPEVAANVNFDELGDLGLSRKDEVDIVAFMMTLSDGWVPERGKSMIAVSGAQLQLAPNPFRTGTSISYSLPLESRVRVRVFDVTGRHVATLVDEVQASGAHATTFALDGRASGVYFVRVETGERTFTTKAIALE